MHAKPTHDELDQSLRRFLEQGGRVSELPAEQPGAEWGLTGSCGDQARHRRRRDRKGRQVIRNERGVTERTEHLADQHATDVLDLLLRGFNLKEVCARVGMSLYSLRELMRSRGISPNRKTKESLARAVELIVAGFDEDRSIAATCALYGLSTSVAYKAYREYARNNPFARKLRIGSKGWELTDDENVALMIRLHMERTGRRLSLALQDLRVGNYRAEQLLELDEIQRKQTSVRNSRPRSW